MSRHNSRITTARQPRHLQTRGFRGRRAFTLLEIIVVVTIIAILATLVAPRLLAQLGNAKQKVARASASKLASALTTYMVDRGLSTVPDDLDLNVLLLGPDEGGGANGPYLQKREELLDPWDHPFTLRVPGIVNHDFDIVSLGEDSQPGGAKAAADVTN